jgi:hypothetical protein
MTLDFGLQYGYGSLIMTPYSMETKIDPQNGHNMAFSYPIHVLSVINHFLLQ